MEKHIFDKKKSYEEKSRAKEDLISKLLLDRQNVKARFAKVSSVATESRDRASDYLVQCCSDRKQLDANCSKVESANPDAEVKKARTGTRI